MSTVIYNSGWLRVGDLKDKDSFIDIEHIHMNKESNLWTHHDIVTINYFEMTATTQKKNKNTKNSTVIYNVYCLEG